jgi:hypothetical protein
MCLLRDLKLQRAARLWCFAMFETDVHRQRRPCQPSASFKLSGSYAIDSFDDHNLRMLAIAEITPEHAAAAFPAYLIGRQFGSIRAGTGTARWLLR